MKVLKDLRWSEYRLVLLVNSLIAMLLSILDLSSDPGTWLREFGINFTFAQSIGSFVYFSACTLDVSRLKRPVFRLVGLPLVFALGGLLGTFLGWGLNHVAFGFSIHASYISTFLIQITLFNVFIATVAYVFFVLRDKLRQAVLKLAEKEVNEQRLLRLKTNAELQALRAKVNPHFLFNTLNSIASLIPIDPHKAEVTVQKLAHLFRYTLESSGEEMVDLADELDLVQEYLDIEKVRFEDRLTYDISMENALSEVAIPGMILQPLVENSIKHAITPNKLGGHIELRCEQNNGYCEIRLRDTGGGFDPTQVDRGFGLSGVRERLNLYYGDKHKLQISGDEGTRVLIRIPTTGRTKGRKERVLEDS
jgi:sensor histidine kinase YesM